MTDPSIEVLAAAAHELWVTWAQDAIMTTKMPAKRIETWRKLFVSFDKIPEEQQEAAREWAKKTLSTLAETGSGFKFQVDDIVRITDARMDARVVSRIEEKTQRMYRVLIWNNGERRSEVLPEDELELIG